jgi:hypothetical protein
MCTKESWYRFLTYSLLKVLPPNLKRIAPTFPAAFEGGINLSIGDQLSGLG